MTSTIITTTTTVKTPTAIALGNFDGIHRGHQTVLHSLIDSLKSSHSATCPTVVSFSPHPREFFTGEKIQFLTPVPQKAELLANLGVEQLVLLTFDRSLAALSPQEFVAKILVRQLQAKVVSVGTDFRFGYQRRGTGKMLQELASQHGIDVRLNSLHKYQDDRDGAVRVSSSLIRQALSTGDLGTANAMLGRPYSLWGTVVTGQQLGRTIGFPTANLELPSSKFLPRFGVYEADVLLGRQIIKGVMNIGCRPTVAGESPTIEVHLLNWSGNLYGRKLRVNLIEFLRSEQKFASVEALKQQITRDCQMVLNN